MPIEGHVPGGLEERPGIAAAIDAHRPRSTTPHTVVFLPSYSVAESLLERETLDSEELDAIMEGREMPPRERVVIPTYADKRNEAREKRKGSIFQPRPREVPSGG